MNFEINKKLIIGIAGFINTSLAIVASLLTIKSNSPNQGIITVGFDYPEFYYISDDSKEEFKPTVTIGWGEMMIHPQLEIIYNDRHVIRLINLENICTDKNFTYDESNNAFVKTNGDKKAFDSFKEEVQNSLRDNGFDLSKIKVNVVYILRLRYSKVGDKEIETKYYLMRNGQVITTEEDEILRRNKEFDYSPAEKEEHFEIIINDCLKKIQSISKKE